jgi:hypothetical protein
MAVKGNIREETDFVKELFVGITSAQVVRFCPTLEERAEMFGSEVGENQTEIKYLDQDKDGNDRVRLDIWLKDVKNGKFYKHAIFLTKKEDVTKDGLKVRLVNATCTTTWAPFIEGTNEVDEKLLLDWFVNFQDKDKNSIGKKKFRKALYGEEEFVGFLSSWLGKLDMKDPDTEVFIDMNKLFFGDFSELNNLIDSGLTKPVTLTLGVETNDELKKYQRIWKKILPSAYINYVTNGFKFPSDYTQKVWNRFEEEINGEYGFKGFTKLQLLKPYNESEDLAASNETKAPEPQSSDY